MSDEIISIDWNSDAIEGYNFSNLNWEREAQCVAYYTNYCYGKNGDEPGNVDVYLEFAEVGADDEIAGITEPTTLWRWFWDDGAMEGNSDSERTAENDNGIWTTREDAEADAKAWAQEQIEEVDVDGEVEAILKTGWFGPDASVDDIRHICEQATEYPDEFFALLPKGEVPSVVTWTNNGYFQCDYVSLPASYSVGAAAVNLRHAIADEENKIREREADRSYDDGEEDVRN